MHLCVNILFEQKLLALNCEAKHSTPVYKDVYGEKPFLRYRKQGA